MPPIAVRKSGGRRIPVTRRHKPTEAEQVSAVLKTIQSKINAWSVANEIGGVTVDMCHLDDTEQIKLQGLKRAVYFRQANALLIQAGLIEVGTKTATVETFEPTTTTNSESESRQAVSKSSETCACCHHTRTHNRYERRLHELLEKHKLVVEPAESVYQINFSQRSATSDKWQMSPGEIIRLKYNMFLFLGDLDINHNQIKIPTTSLAERLSVTGGNFDDVEDSSSSSDEDEIPELMGGKFGVNEDDIEIIMNQVIGCSREEAAQALEENNGDLVNAIMQLTI